MSEEQDLNGHGQSSMEHNHNDQKNLAGLLISPRSAQGTSFLSRKATERPNPTATKIQLSRVMLDQLIRATGIQIRLE